MAIKRYNSATGKWEYVGNPGSITPNGIGAVSNAGGSLVVPANASTKGISIQATASQSANLQEWQNSSGVAQTYIDPNGNFYSPNLNYAGKNALINGGFDIWQRGTSFLNPANSYTADRWVGSSASAFTLSRQSTGLNGIPYCARLQRTSSSSSTANMNIAYSLESNDSYKFQGQTATLSFYARAGSNFSASGNLINPVVAYGTGIDQNAYLNGFTNQAYLVNTTVSITTSWVRYSYTFSIPSTATQLATWFVSSPTGTAGTNDYWDITGVQLELGTVATPFSRAGGTYQGELAACQRYYQRISADASSSIAAIALGFGTATTNGCALIPTKISMRIVPSVSYSALGDFYFSDLIASANYTPTSIAISGIRSTTTNVFVNFGFASGITTGRFYSVQANVTTGYFDMNSEL